MSKQSHDHWHGIEEEPTTTIDQNAVNYGRAVLSRRVIIIDLSEPDIKSRSQEIIVPEVNEFWANLPA